MHAPNAAMLMNLMGVNHQISLCREVSAAFVA